MPRTAESPCDLNHTENAGADGALEPPEREIQLDLDDAGCQRYQISDDLRPVAMSCDPGIELLVCPVGVGGAAPELDGGRKLTILGDSPPLDKDPRRARPREEGPVAYDGGGAITRQRDGDRSALLSLPTAALPTSLVPC
jgi:hypothetical protein